MKQKLTGLKFFGIAIIFLFCISFTAFSQKESKPMTVKGEVLDMSCYMSGGAKGAGHKACATKCINGGSPMGILTDDGKVYLLVENHKKADAYASAKKYAGEQVVVTGNYADRGGVQGLVVDEVKAPESK